MTTAIKSRLTILELQLSKACKCNVEITIRGLDKFTLSFAGDSVKSLAKAKAFLAKSKRITSWQTVYDEELNETFAYFTVAL